MHAVRIELLRRQAAAVGLPLELIPIPAVCSNELYECAMANFVQQALTQGIECFAFGDLFLRDIREYRESKLADTGITPLFPLWELPTRELAREMVREGLRARVTCLDPKQMPREFAGREFNDSFLNELPESVDPCGERGEFHTFAFAGPMFSAPVSIGIGETIERDGFLFTDILPRPDADEESRWVVGG